MPERHQFFRWTMGWVFAGLFCFVLPAAAGTGEWKRFSEENGIIGYERKVDGSAYRETKAEATIEAPMEVLLAVLMDVPRYTKWMYKCRRTELIENHGDEHRLFYFLQGGPMGSPDRWALIDARTSVDLSAGISVTTLESVDREYQPLEDSALRMDRFSGRVELKMAGRNRTRVRYTVFIDPGKHSPARVAREVIRKVSFETVRNLIAKAGDPNYIRAAEKGAVKPKIERAIAAGSLKFGTTAE